MLHYFLKKGVNCSLFSRKKPQTMDKNVKIRYLIKLKNKKSQKRLTEKLHFAFLQKNACAFIERLFLTNVHQHIVYLGSEVYRITISLCR